MKKIEAGCMAIIIATAKSKERYIGRSLQVIEVAPAPFWCPAGIYWRTSLIINGRNALINEECLMRIDDPEMEQDELTQVAEEIEQ